MRHPLCSLLQRAFYLLPAAFLLCSCVDSSVDYDDIDMKMKFNVDGLKVKFGDTEKIKLADLLKPEGNIKTDGNGMYYLVEQGQTHFDFTVKKPSAEVDANQLNVGYNFGDDIWKEVMKRLDDRQKATLAQTGYEVPVNEQPNYIAFEEADEFDFDLSWENDIVRLKRIDLENATFNFKLKLQDGVAKNFAIYGFRNVKITLPSYIKSNSANFKDGVYTFADRKFSEGQHEIDLGQLTVDSVAFAQALTSPPSAARKVLHQRGNGDGGENGLPHGGRQSPEGQHRIAGVNQREGKRCGERNKRDRRVQSDHCTESGSHSSEKSSA